MLVLGLRRWMEVLSRVVAERPSLPVLILTGLRETEIGPLALRVGAAGTVARQRASRELPEAICRAARGERYVSPTLGAFLADALLRGQDLGTLGAAGGLSLREVQIVRLTAQGLRRREIAAHMAIAPATVTTYQRRARAKLGLRTNIDLVRYALTYGLVSDEPFEPPPASGD